MNRVLKTSASILVLAMALGGPSAVLAAPGDDNFNQSASTAFAGGPITTDARSWREVVLPDGSSVVVGPGSSVQVSIENGAVRIAIAQGSIRVTEGRNRGEAGPIVITTPDGRADLAGGSAVVRYRNGATTATLIFGRSLVLTSGGTTQTIIRPGFSSRFGTAGFVGSPDRLSPEEASLDVADVSPAPTVRMAQRSTQSARATTSNNNRRRDPTETGSIPGESNAAPASQRTNRTNNRPSQNSRIAALNTQTGLLTIGEDTDEQNGTGLNNGIIANRQFQRGDAVFTDNRDSNSNNSNNNNQNETNPRLRINLAPDLLEAGRLTRGIEGNTASSAGQNSSLDFDDLGSVRIVRSPADRDARANSYLDRRSDNLNYVLSSREGDVELSSFTMRQHYMRDYIIGASPYRRFVGDPVTAPVNGDFRPCSIDSTAACLGYWAGSSLFDFGTYSRPPNGNSFDIIEDIPGLVTNTKAPTRGGFPLEQYGSTAPIGKYVLVGRPIYDQFGRSINASLAQVGDYGQSSFFVFDLYFAANDRVIAFGGAGPGQGGLNYNENGNFLDKDLGNTEGGRNGFELPGTGGALVNGNRVTAALPGAPVPSFFVSRYGISDGLSGFEVGRRLEDQLPSATGFTTNSAFRRESTFAFGPNGDPYQKGDTHLLVASRAQPAGNLNAGDNVIMRGDHQLTADGRSNVSVTVGDISLKSPSHLTMVADARIVGTTRTTANAGSVLITGPVGSIGTGYRLTATQSDGHFFGGNTRMTTIDPTSPATFEPDEFISTSRGPLYDQIGYFAIGSADNRFEQDPGGKSPFDRTGSDGLTVRANTTAGVTETGAGNSVSTSFTRIAIGMDNTAPNQLRTPLHQGSTAETNTFSLSSVLSDGGAFDGTRRTRAPEVGYAAGIGESLRDGELFLTSLTPSSLPNVSVTARHDLNRVGISINLTSRDLTTDGVDATAQNISLTFAGGASVVSDTYRGLSAYVTEKAYGAVTATNSGTTAGVVVAPGDLARGMRRPGQADAHIRSDYNYVQWGYFFGDVLSEGGRTDRVNLGHYVAGTRPEATIGYNGNVSAVYTGHVAATVFDQTNGLRDHIGALRSEWNFASRANVSTTVTGIGGRDYSGTLNALTPSGAGSVNAIAGQLNHTGGLSAMTFNGQFFGPAQTAAPPEMAGAVSIRANAGAPVHVGEGIFIAKTPPQP